MKSSELDKEHSQLHRDKGEKKNILTLSSEPFALIDF